MSRLWRKITCRCRDGVFKVGVFVVKSFSKSTYSIEVRRVLRKSSSTVYTNINHIKSRSSLMWHTVPVCGSFFLSLIYFGVCTLRTITNPCNRSYEILRYKATIPVTGISCDSPYRCSIRSLPGYFSRHTVLSDISFHHVGLRTCLLKDPK